MRIISGEFKGRIIKTPPPKFTRPTTDKVKESLFNYLNNFIDFSGINVCDIYSGSGSLGFEALSRGAKMTHFVEKNFQVYKVLHENIIQLNLYERTKIFKMDATRFTSIKDHIKYDLILADPPFFKNDIHKVVDNILTSNFLTEGGLLIVERSKQTEKEDIKAFKVEPIKKLGDSLIYQFKTE